MDGAGHTVYRVRPDLLGVDVDLVDVALVPLHRPDTLGGHDGLARHGALGVFGVLHHLAADDGARPLLGEGQLHRVGLPDDEEVDDTIAWTSSDTDVVTVDSTGKVTT